MQVPLFSAIKMTSRFSPLRLRTVPQPMLRKILYFGINCTAQRLWMYGRLWLSLGLHTRVHAPSSIQEQTKLSMSMNCRKPYPCRVHSGADRLFEKHATLDSDVRFQCSRSIKAGRTLDDVFYDLCMYIYLVQFALHHVHVRCTPICVQISFCCIYYISFSKESIKEYISVLYNKLNMK